MHGDPPRHTFPEPVAEAIRRKWLPGPCCQKCQVVGWRSIEHNLQVWMHRDLEPRTGLILANAQDAIADMLASHSVYIAAALGRTEKLQ